MAHLFTQPPNIEPIPVVGTIFVSSTSSAPRHAITLDRPLSHFDFEDSNEGKCHFAALQRLQALLTQGFRSIPNPNAPISRGSWLVIATELMVTLHKSIRASHGNDPSPRVFKELDPEEASLLQLLGKTCESFHIFFDPYQKNHEEWSTCLRCLEQCHRPIDKAKYESVAMSCGQSIAAIHATIVNDVARTLQQEAAKWSEGQLKAIKDALISGIIAEDITKAPLASNPLIDSDDNRLANWLTATSHDLREHTKAMLLDQTVDKYVVPWASERIDAATGQLLATSSDRIRDLRADAEKRANDDAHKFHADTLAALKTEAQARAEADAFTFYKEVLARRKAEVKEALDQEIDTFKHQLRIDTMERKTKAQEAADKSVSALTKSSAKANKSKARHDPMGKGMRSRTHSVSSSRPPSPSQISDQPPSSDVQLPHTPEAQVMSLMEAAPIEVTPKATPIKTPEAAADAMAPMMVHLNALEERKASYIWENMISSIADNTQKQLAAFSDSVAKQINDAVAPLVTRISGVEKENAFLTGEVAWSQLDDDDLMEVGAADPANIPVEVPLPIPNFIDSIIWKNRKC